MKTYLKKLLVFVIPILIGFSSIFAQKVPVKEASGINTSLMDLSVKPSEPRDEISLDDIKLIVSTTTNPAPLIENVVYTPYPTTSDGITVTADVCDVNGTVSSVQLKYVTRMDNNKEGYFVKLPDKFKGTGRFYLLARQKRI